MEDAFEACVTQTHVVPGFLVRYHQKVALNGGCSGEYGHHTDDEPLQQWVRVVQSVPILPVRGALVKSVNGCLHIRLAALQVTQGLVLAPDILNLLDAEGVVKTLPVALQIDVEFTGQNADKLMGWNTVRSINIGFIVFFLLCNDGTDTIHQSEDGGR